MSGLQIHTLSDATMARWDQFVETSNAATFFHRAACKTILERSFGHSTYFLYAEEHGEVQGVLPLVHVRSRLFGNSLVSTACGVYGGPAADSAAARVETPAITSRGIQPIPRRARAACGLITYR